MTTVAILGTGRMGSALARRLAGAGFEPTLWNRTRGRAEAVGVGRVVDTPADAVRGADIVISSLTGPEAVRATYGGAHGALSAAAGQLFVEMSTAGPDVIAELRPQVAAASVAMIDAPIVGAPPTVLRGAAAVLVGGAGADVERATPVLGNFGEVRHVGALGSGARLKLVANSMLATVTTAAAELQTAGEMAALEAEDVFWVLARLVPALELRRAGLVEDRHQPALFAVRDLDKDLGLALDLFGQSSSDVPLTALVAQLVAEADAIAGDLDISAVIRRYRPSGVRLMPAGARPASHLVRHTP
jgi:3-hydroxyisobutyrate dehydrogenase-like beta-hydroxyacid dehydrogenase